MRCIQLMEDILFYLFNGLNSSAAACSSDIFSSCRSSTFRLPYKHMITAEVIEKIVTIIFTTRIMKNTLA